MRVHGKGSIVQLDKGADGNKPRSKCRRWRLQVVTDEGRRSRPFEGTYTAAQAALAAFVEELEDVVPNAETFAAYAESWRRYRELSGDYDPNTVATYRRCVNAFARSPIGGMRMDAITPESCRDALLWVKSHPQREGLEELSGTTMAKLHQGLHLILATAAGDGRIASNPMSKVKPPKLDTPEKTRAFLRSLPIPTAFTPMPLSEAVATLPNFFHAYTMARASSPSIVTGTPSRTLRRTRA